MVAKSNFGKKGRARHSVRVPSAFGNSFGTGSNLTGRFSQSSLRLKCASNVLPSRLAARIAYIVEISSPLEKRAGQNPARLEYSQIKLEIVRYLFVAGNEGGTAFVPAGGGVLVSSAGLQPVSIIPTARPSNTTRVDILFIGTRNFYQNQVSDKQKHLLILDLEDFCILGVS
jgi:hypothetical protein